MATGLKKAIPPAQEGRQTETQAERKADKHMILKWPKKRDDGTNRPPTWEYLDGVRQVTVDIQWKSVPMPGTTGDSALDQDGAVLDVVMDNGESKIIFAQFSAFLISDKTGQTIDRLL
jgi:hypothetical protein